MSLKGSQTEQNLKDAFAGESQANRRYLYFAQKADVEGYNDVSALFRSTAEGETGHAHGHLEYLEEVGDPATGMPIGGTEDNLKSAVAGETHEYTDSQNGQNPRGLRPLGFWPWDFPRDFIHHYTPSAFPHIVPVHCSSHTTVSTVHCSSHTAVLSVHCSSHTTVSTFFMHPSLVY